VRGLARLASRIALALVGLGVTFAVLEVGLRVHDRLAFGLPMRAPSRFALDPELGWAADAVLGDVASRRPKILVLGDSYSSASLLGGAGPEMYFVVIGRALDAEVFAFAGLGYGTLQEAIILHRVFPHLRPDLVILQVCFNDFINNSLELERASYLNNNLAVRPYLVNGGVEYHAPTFFGASLTSRSRLAGQIALGVQRIAAVLAARGHLETVETRIGHQGMNYEPFRRSVATTNLVIAAMKAAVGETPLVAFTTDDAFPFFETWRAIFHERGVPFVEVVPARLREMEARGVALRHPDGAHWNAAGQAAVGRLLADWLSERGYLREARR
jgi:lysophospholipase L1-like esterase